MSTFTRKLEEQCRAEFARFTTPNGKRGHEDVQPYRGFVKEYWKSIDLPFDGASKDAKGNDIPWSAAFISFVVRKAGAGDRFLYKDAHHHYIRQALLAKEDGVAGAAYVARRPADYAPKVGDLVAKGRSGAKTFNYDKALGKARQSAAKDRAYPSHCDVVVAVDLPGRKITTIGGNLVESVRRNEVKIDANGRLVPYKEKNSAGVLTSFPWIAVLEARI